MDRLFVFSKGSRRAVRFSACGALASVLLAAGCGGPAESTAVVAGTDEVGEASQEVSACGAVVGSVTLPDGRVVHAYSNGSCTEGSCSCAGQLSTGLGYQCVEYVQRFARDYSNGAFSGWFGVGAAKQLCSVSLPANFIHVASPAPYDIFVRTVNQSGGYSAYGHAAVVKSVSGGTMTIVQENKTYGEEVVSVSVYSGHQCFIRYTGGALSMVQGAIREKYLSLGGANSVLGLPTTYERITPDGYGRYNHFQRGSIYWTWGTGAHEVHGSIRDKWASIGWERSYLGYPTTDETVTPDGYGRYNHFQRGSVYWSPASGAHEVQGAIREKWASIGWERSRLGYPTTDEFSVNGGKRSNFQGGFISWNSRTGAVLINLNPYMEGAGCSATMKNSCAAYGCGCYNNSCKGGACAP